MCDLVFEYDWVISLSTTTYFAQVVHKAPAGYSSLVVDDGFRARNLQVRYSRGFYHFVFHGLLIERVCVCWEGGVEMGSKVVCHNKTETQIEDPSVEKDKEKHKR